MATEKQIEANRRNAQQSTGPRTADGKLNSSRNATRHGLAAQGFIVIEGQEEHFLALQNGLRQFLSPEGPTQALLFTNILTAAWNLRRCRLAEAEVFLRSDQSVDPLLDQFNEAKYARIRRYAKENDAALYKGLRALGELQTEIAFRKKAFPLTSEQRADDDYFSKSPHALSDVCRFEKVISLVNRISRNEANLAAAQPLPAEPLPPQASSPASEPSISGTKPIAVQPSLHPNPLATAALPIDNLNLPEPAGLQRDLC